MLSLWTHTKNFRFRYGHLLVHTLAVCLAKRRFRKLVFVTDSDGADLAQVLGWRFDRVMTSFDTASELFEGLEHVWALGKIVACLQQAEPFIQLDGDVLLFKRFLPEFSHARLVAQSVDKDVYYEGRDMVRGFSLAGLPINCRKYNTGLLGGNDVSLVHDWASYALGLARAFKYNETIDGTIASMIVEQASLGVFAQRRGVDVETILPHPFSQKDIESAGYAHLIGIAKQDAFWLKRVRSRLMRDFPLDFDRFEEGCKRITIHPEPILQHMTSAL